MITTDEAEGETNRDINRITKEIKLRDNLDKCEMKRVQDMLKNTKGALRETLI